MSGYPSSPIYVFDPYLPWTTGKVIDGKLIKDRDEKANPKLLTNLNSINLAGTHKMYAGEIGADGKIYFGGRWMRNGECGGLGWYDPETGKPGGIWKEFSNYQITHMTKTTDGKLLVISTKKVTDSVLGKPKPKSGALFIFDTIKGEIIDIFEIIPKAKGIGPIIGIGERFVFGWTENPGKLSSSIIYLFDINNKTFIYKKVIPFKLPVSIGSNQDENWDFRLGPDKKIWTFVNNVLVKIKPENGNIEPVGKLKIPGPIAFSNGEIYLGGTTYLRKIKNLKVD